MPAAFSVYRKDNKVAYSSADTLAYNWVRMSAVVQTQLAILLILGHPKVFS
ncbi:hypothetical protein SAMN04488500_1035 [Sporomusa malonica]|uniref:Uncharacterized protein n=1 Tax=Sporomusa malonica TaxID=112901 RepID=A0A1W1Z5A5_9FIRM|nr:hypothetical protein SAMN04488500_1035 [Sporomusa malonica]